MKKIIMYPIFILFLLLSDQSVMETGDNIKHKEENKKNKPF
jgi:hypothetical protein